ncbi:glycosyl transferase [Flavobacterium noncentrifugens]|uniref:Glycosyltransferase involved in cell wall bisynthesis n=1 Tax=Flavobacterium noncentrifugens TaxID=1128970 RepID=A0A1G9ATD4_9FLAO|nr:glycosyltransferase family 4 protein [Flavobacterium noncentrifugens]GEP51576.1 glycosyl transferase [Flavobacterium noncentrifugens]SDK30507.1 Glycosyltransferase involved in cell wall bisynthesis [Flavobacterium noncentrifugens]
MNNQKVLIIGMVWPEPNSSAAGTRMLQLIGLLQQNGCEIIFASAASDSEFAFDVTQIGIGKVSIVLNDASFDEFVKTLNPQMVLFDRFVTEEQFGWRVAENCPNALRILDTEDLHFLRLARQLAFKEKREFSTHDLFSDTAKREIASILRCDLSLIISKTEMELLKNDFKIDASLLHYLPFLVDEIKERVIESWPGFSDRKDFVFIGNFLHEPNWNTVQYLKETIWPRINELLPDVSLQVYGAYPSQKALQLHKPFENFYINGRATSATAVVKKARVVLAPIRFGAGAKGKLIEAMQCGTPSVTTTIGAESMHGNFSWNGTIANDPEEIAKAAAELYQNETLWKQSQSNGITIINNRYSKHIFEKNFIDAISEIQSKLAKHRQQNFIGAILQHHLLTSTKYLSRWIEAKNSKN